MSNRKNLPYRETSDCFLLYRGKLVARTSVNSNTNKKFLSLPGGGIDDGETPLQGAKRECIEEVGAKLKSLKVACTVCWDWYPERADTPKRKDRYKKFRGEKIHIMVGEVDKFVKPTSDEGDDWKGKKLMSLSSAIKIMNEGQDHENMYPYRIAQITVLNMLKLFKK
jgi:8-oxo-dGTP pyrophosphatase MutT (NUDIX family)